LVALRGSLLLASLLCACRTGLLDLPDALPDTAVATIDSSTGDSSTGRDLARADSGATPCGAVSVSFLPGAHRLQIAIWVEEKATGRFVDTLYVTKATGYYGLGNRPGNALLKTDCGWPYGRREMVLPVWAHRRDHHYPKITMGGICGNSQQSLCPDGTPCGGDCNDDTAAYHAKVISYEPYYCTFYSGGCMGPPEQMVCDARGAECKGAYLPFPGTYSLYPPRADLAGMLNPKTDSPDVADFANRNDLIAVSQATPLLGNAGDPPLAIHWSPAHLPEGNYVVWVEVSKEADFNAFHNHPNQPDAHEQWDFLGYPFLGQPSIVYAAPFHYQVSGDVATTIRYVGYGAWDGADGTLRPPDGTITVGVDGTGEGRLLTIDEQTLTYKVKVVVAACGK
jgi:hypothetical protein